jgi:hypothetical protein
VSAGETYGRSFNPTCKRVVGVVHGIVERRRGCMQLVSCVACVIEREGDILQGTPSRATGRLLSNFLNFAFNWPPESSTVTRFFTWNCLHPVSATRHQARFLWERYGKCAWQRVAETGCKRMHRARISKPFAVALVVTCTCTELLFAEWLVTCVGGMLYLLVTAV